MMHIRHSLLHISEKWRGQNHRKRHPGHLSYAEWLETVETFIWPTWEGYAYDMDYMEPVAAQLWAAGETVHSAVRQLLDTWVEMCEAQDEH